MQSTEQASRSPGPLIRDRRLRRLLGSRFLADAGVNALLYGALISVVRDSGSALEAAVVAAASLAPAALLGLWGGSLADRLPRRQALAGGYLAQACLCLLAAIVADAGFPVMVTLIFAVMSIGQVTGPTESAILPQFTDEARLPAATSLLSLVSGIGIAFGTALLAPFIVRLLDVRTLFVVSGALLVLAALPVGGWKPWQRSGDVTAPHVSVGALAILRWFLEERAVGSMMMLLALASVTNVIATALGPRYVQELFDLDPAEAVYVFAPSAVGMLLALAVAPAAVTRLGSRRFAMLGFAFTAVSLLGLGLVDYVATVVDPANPARLLTNFAHIGRYMRTAGVLAIPLGFGLGAASIAVNSYVSRQVQFEFQGRAFAMLSTLKTGLALLPLLAVGTVADSVGVQPVLVAAPFALLIIAIAAHLRLRPHPWRD